MNRNKEYDDDYDLDEDIGAIDDDIYIETNIIDKVRTKVNNSKKHKMKSFKDNSEKKYK